MTYHKSIADIELAANRSMLHPDSCIIRSIADIELAANRSSIRDFSLLKCSIADIELAANRSQALVDKIEYNKYSRYRIGRKPQPGCL